MRGFFLNALRIVTGFLFWAHGAQKLPGWFGAERTFDFPTLLWWAGTLEFFGGILILVGLWTRPVAVLLAGEMALAYFLAHAPRDFWPIQNGGELAALYCFVFLLLAAGGGGSFSVDGVVRSRKRGEIAG